MKSSNKLIKLKSLFCTFMLILTTTLFFSCKNPFMSDIETTEEQNSKPSATAPENDKPAKKEAIIPEITKNLTESLTITSGKEFTLSVEAKSKDGGNLSYEWFEANDDKSAGQKIEKQSTNKLSLKKTLAGEETEKVFYYYVKVTNTIGTGNNKDSKSITSKRAKIVINKLENAGIPVINIDPNSYEGFRPEKLTLKATVSISSGKNGNVSYKWFTSDSPNKEGTIISSVGGIPADYEVPVATFTGTKYYWCEVTNTIDDNKDGGIKSKSAVSEKIKVTIIEPSEPEITKNLADQTISSGNKFKLDIEAASPDKGQISYKWFKAENENVKGIEIKNNTGNTLEETITLNEDETCRICYYYAEITNTITFNNEKKSKTVKSNYAKVTIDKKVNASVPEITQVSPSYEGVKPKDNKLDLIIEASVSDGGTLSYQWYKAAKVDSEGINIANATNKSYTIEDVDLKGTTYYWCKITNTIADNKDGGIKSQSAVSEKIKVTIQEPKKPEITTDLTDLSVYSGEEFILSVEAISLDNGTLSYKWFEANDSTSAGTEIQGETGPALKKIITLSNDQKETNKFYYVEIINSIGPDDNKKSASIKTNHAKVTVKRNTLGFNHPSDGTKYSPVDTNGEATGFGWNTATYALGANVSGGDVEFAVYSKNADKILLEIYDKAYGKDAIHDYWMEKGTDDIWRAKVSGIGAGTLYGFRCWGPNWTFDESWTRGNSSSGFVKDYDEIGNRFNPNKVLFDPYAKEMSHDKSNPEVFKGTGLDAGMYGTGAEDYHGTERRNFDTGKYAPKAVVVNDSTGTGTKPAIPQEKARIYEAHVRGLTNHSSTAQLSSILSGIDGFDKVQNVPDNLRGTYAGAAYMAPYLKALGINTIELLPVHETDNDHNTGDASSFVDGKPAGNFWGYMTYGYFAPDRRYSSDKSYGGPTKEFKDMVRAFHDAGIEVYLDVVFNHSGEGGQWYGKDSTKYDNYNTAEITFMRGFDCSEYYCLTPGDVGDHWNTTGCGNNLRCDNPPVRNLIIDSLTYWIDEMGVDGYRFDLAPVLGREFKGNTEGWKYTSAAETLTAIKNLGSQKNAEMIAEAWDCHGGDGYQVGQFPTGWGEWNGRFRDGLRGYVNGGNAQAKDGSITQYINGDYNNFYDQGGPHKSVNFVVAHDGFTLADLCSYPGAGNALNETLSWPFGPSDGGNSDNNPLAFGNTPEMKRQANRNYTAIQMMSRGVPMIVYGDEFCRTQNGNNNPYNIDSVATWNNYNMINTASPQAVATGAGGTYTDSFGTFGNDQNKNGNFMFMKYMLDLKANEPALNQPDYTVPYNFRKENGTENLNDGDRCIWLHIDGDKVAGGSDYLVFMNMWEAAVDFTIPAEAGKTWVKLVDTANYGESNYNYWPESLSNKLSGKYNVKPWSVVILKQKTLEKTTAPVINAKGSNLNGSNFTDKITIEIKGTTGTDIFYTLDGTIPNSGSTKYTSPFEITTTTTIKAIALKKDCAVSDVVEKKYTNTAKLLPPVLSVPAGDFWNTITVFVTSTDGNKDFYYTTDGVAEPTTKSIKYSAETGIDIKDTTTLKVAAINASGIKSDVVTAKYTKQADKEYTENPYGVMLQGFNWDSAPRGPGYTAETPNPKWGTWYSTMKANATDMQKFEYVWFPPASKTDSASSEGYAPTELNDLNSFYGTEAELKAVTAAIAPAKPIADIVVNHRAGSTSWGDFQNPKWTEDYYSICGDDEGFTATNSPMNKSSNRGANDTGGQYDAYRDLDHTNPAVQKGITSWMNTVLKRAGFTGWRYDYVKGFDGKYVGQYNTATNPSMSVGELWPDGAASGWKTEIDKWLAATTNSKAFDFVLKSNMNEAFGWSKPGENHNDNWNLALLASENSLMRYNPAAAVTFIDNHDTGSTQQHWELDPGDLGPAYAFLLTHPGYPCVAWQHYFTGEGNQYRGGDIVPGTDKTFKQHIDTLIELRNSVGIKNTNAVTVLASTTTNYVAKITGDKSEIIVKIGGDNWKPEDEGYKNRTPIYSGTNFSIWEKGKGEEVLPPEPGTERTITFTVQKDGQDATWLWNADDQYPDKPAVVYLWAWDAHDSQWIECTGTGATAIAKVPQNITNVQLIRFAGVTTKPDWDQTIWNRTPDGTSLELNATDTTYTINIQ